jgi:hypothetical protein
VPLANFQLGALEFADAPDFSKPIQARRRQKLVALIVGGCAIGVLNCVCVCLTVQSSCLSSVTGRSIQHCDVGAHVNSQGNRVELVYAPPVGCDDIGRWKAALDLVRGGAYLIVCLGAHPSCSSRAVSRHACDGAATHLSACLAPPHTRARTVPDTAADGHNVLVEYRHQAGHL